MACYYPISVFILPDGGISYNRSKETNWLKKGKIPCGQCIGCRLEKSRSWAIRCMHESSLYPENSFITLTYNNENLPKNGSLNKKHFQDFMKRLRKKYSPKKIRYYQCGEYGDKLSRPHYHACLFNHQFDDKVYFKKTNDSILYTSQILDKLWPYGFSLIGDVTFESAAYVARYILKKINGDLKKSHYEKVDITTGEVINLQPEYTTMSRKPGLAKDWYDKYKDDVFPHDFVVNPQGKKIKTPDYYFKQYQISDPQQYEKIKNKRKEATEKHQKNNTKSRLLVRETIQQSKLQKLIRHKEI